VPETHRPLTQLLHGDDAPQSHVSPRLKAAAVSREGLQSDDEIQNYWQAVHHRAACFICTTSGTESALLDSASARRGSRGLANLKTEDYDA